MDETKGETMAESALMFLAGLAGSMHCLGMCGGFACALGADPRGGGATARRHLLYNLGRITTYCFIGAVAGQLGLMLVGHDGEGTPASLAQRALALAAGLLMVVVGLQFLGVLGRLPLPRLEAAAARLGAVLATLLHAPGAAAPLALGVANGFLPCPLVYAFVAQAAASGSALAGLSTMAAFGLGTLPMMLAAGGLGLRLRAAAMPPGGLAAAGGQVLRLQRRPQAAGAAGLPLGVARRQLGLRLAGAFIIGLGLVTCARGLLPLGAHLHGL
jgi:sulfite exporter TauE/SafE